ncbi:ATP-binding protein [Xanthocytophaga flava]|uniref:ATP-binding protein n=1 Tax=Xanthocytophaga flava TaxID=3048013 RepID=UPI0028CFEEAB|nr:ATP-binding protein [Xanthocytophaga flavus]MDJ1466185.1 ATP-binding protein [Xanthocytophaga flavus]
MENIKPSFSELFEQIINFPDPQMQQRLNLLVGLDRTKETLQKMLALLIDPLGIKEWTEKHHRGANSILSFVTRRPPLIILAGDVGSGKSELATTIGDVVARKHDLDVTLYPLSLSTRGQGRVGQMTQLISSAFEYTLERAKKLKSESAKSKGAVILLIDEADALAQSRENSQMHHEDKAGVNAFIRGIDSLGNGKLPAAVIMCTNRPNALDPAIKRRAAEIIYFGRPSDLERFQVLEQPLTELSFTSEQINRIVELTGAQNGKEYGCTFSDLVQRLLPSFVLDAYPDKPVDPDRAIEIAKDFIPTAPFKES